MLIHGDALTELRKLEANSVDSLVTDPPSGIAFMGKEWDKDKGGRDKWIAWLAEIAAEALRVLKPGAYGVVWALPRTSHWTATALENAGFEVRDVITHLYGQGFPKSLDVSKALDKELGATRIVTGTKPGVRGADGSGYESQMPGKAVGVKQVRVDVPVTAPATDEARRYEGYGTALKPAAEFYILVRKPLGQSVAKNVLEYGSGALNIDASRIGTEGGGTHCTYFPNECQGHKTAGGAYDSIHKQGSDEPKGRWPANVITDLETPWAKYFYCPKPSTRERNEGLENLPDRLGGSLEGGDDKRSGKPQLSMRKNHHPTVKALSLMEYLIRLVTPAGGKVLDCFAGSGTTLLAAQRLGFNTIGIEQDETYIEIAQARLSAFRDSTRAEPFAPIGGV